MKNAKRRVMFALSALLLSVALQACSQTKPVTLSPIPAPPPVIVHVPTYVALPLDATDPCPKPQARPIRTDVDLLKAAMAWKVASECNANKLAAILGAQP